MRVQCGDCSVIFDDAERSCVCPHPSLFASPEHRARKLLALSLLETPLWWAHQRHGPPLYVESMNHDGMVTIRGFSGEFHPSLFVRAAEVIDSPPVDSAPAPADNPPE